MIKKDNTNMKMGVPNNYKKIIYFLMAVFICLMTVSIAEAQVAPVIHYSSATAGPNQGWEGSTTRGASISLWVENIGTSRGNSTLTVAGVTLKIDSDFAEWGANTYPKTAKNLSRVTFWLNSSMPAGNTDGIYLTVNGVSSNTIPFTIDNTGNIYVYPDDSSAQGWSNLDTATESMEPGDFIYLRAGTYTETWNLGYLCSKLIDGTDNLRITMTSYPGEDAVIASNNLKIMSSYWTITNLHFHNGAYLQAGGQKDFCVDGCQRYGLRVIGNEWSGTGHHAIQAFGHDFEIYANYVNYIPTEDTSYPFYMCSGNNRVIKDNEIHGGARWSIHVYDEDRPSCTDTNRVLSNWTIEGNILDSTDAGFGYRGSLIMQANNVAQIDNITVKNNILYSSGSVPTEALIRIRHNVDGVNIYNNTLYNGPVGIVITDDSPTNIVIKNNIISGINGLDVQSRYAAPGEVIIDNNLYDTTQNMDNTEDISPLIGNPQFTNTDSYDFHLTGSSPAIDTAITLAEVIDDFEQNPRPMDGDENGTAEYDIGAYEYTGTYIPPTPDSEAPSIPSGLTATATSSIQIDLSWNASTDNVGVTGYRIYRDGSQIGTSNSTSYSDTGLSPSTTYTYTVEAYDAAGNSALSAPVSVATPASPDTEDPTVPSGLSATATSSTQIDLSWNASTDNVGVTGYRIYRDGSQVGTTTSTSYSDSGLSPLTTYTYTVKAYDAAANESAESASASATTLSSPDTEAPTVPSGLNAAAASDTEINLSWNSSTDNVGVTGYRIYRDGIQIDSSSNTTYSDINLTPSTTFTYTVRAYDAAGNESAESAPVSATTLDLQIDSIAPSHPLSLSIVQK